MPLSDLVIVNVSSSNPSVTVAGFGTPLIVTPNAWATPERTRSYTGTDGVLADFAATTPEYKAAAAIFSQQPAPSTVMIGKLLLKPTMIQVVTLLAATAAAAYKINVYVTGVLQSVTHTAASSAAWVALTVYTQGTLVTNDTGKLYVCITAGTAAGAGGPTGTAADITDGTAHWMYAGAGGSGVASNDAIVYNLMNAINALAAPAPNFAAALTGSVASKVITCTGSASGNWFALEPVNSADPSAVSNLMSLAETSADPGTATDLGQLKNASSAWYGLLLLHKSALILAAAAAWTETNTKLLIASSVDTKIANDADSGATDVAHTLKSSAYARTHLDYHPRAFEFMDAAEVGRFFPVLPGGDNWRMKTLVGVTAVNFTPTQQTNMTDKRVGYYYVLGASGTSPSVLGGEGKTSSGEFIDITRGIDSWSADVAAGEANLIIQANKIPFTDDGIAQLEAVVRQVNKTYVGRGLINPGSPPQIAEPTVTAPKSGAVSSVDRAARSLTGLTSVWTVAGAINKLTVSATVLR